MSATAELRRMLDERGVEWSANDTYRLLVTSWKDANGHNWAFIEHRDGNFSKLTAYHLTPAQAIEATLGTAPDDRAMVKLHDRLNAALLQLERGQDDINKRISAIASAHELLEEAATLGQTVTGETSDGYHTFNELYHHRAVLFSVIVRDHPELAWKSKLHNDGTMYDGMFIVGINTPKGQATYHYHVDPYWEMFGCRELERAPEWDGHTPDQAIERIATLGAGTCYPVPIYGFDGEFTEYDCDACSACGTEWDGDMPNFCPNCGRKVVDE